MAKGSRPSGGGGSGSTMKHVGAATVTDWAEKNQGRAMEFAHNPPESITVGGVRFDKIGGDPYRSYDGRTTRYASDYQSSVRATNGEWPTIQVVVKSTTRRKVTKYEIVTGGGLGTRLT